MQNRCILFLTDNEALVYVINKQSCKDKNLMFFVRKLVLVCCKTIFFLRPNMLGAFITLSQTLCLDYRWIHSSVWPQSTWSGSQQTFLCICSLRTGTCYYHTITVQPATFLTSNLSAGVEAFFTILHVILPSVSTTLTISPPVLALFIAYMYDRHYAPSTVSTYVSALGYCHKLSGFPDPTKAFLLFRCLRVMESLGLVSIVGCQLPCQF